MKIVMMPIRVFEIGDRVITPQGKGTILEDNFLEKKLKKDESYKSINHKIKIQHDSGVSNNADNLPVIMESWIAIPIQK